MNLVRIGSHLLVHLDEGLIGSLSASLDAILDSLDHLVVASQGCSISILELGVGSLTSIVEGSLNESNIVLHLLADGLGVSHHGVVVGSELLVEATLALWALGVGGCLNLHLATLANLEDSAHDTSLGAHLVAVSEESLVLVHNGFVEGCHSVSLVSIDSCLKRLASSVALGLLSIEVGVELGELALSPGDGVLEVLLSELLSGLDCEDDLLLHLSASLLGLEGELGDLGVDVLGESGDLGGDAVVHLGASLSVDVGHLLLDSESASLTLCDDVSDGGVESVLVSLGHLLQLSAALSVLDGVLSHDAGELHDLAVLLLLEFLDSLVKLGRLRCKLVLSLAESVLSIDLRAAGCLGQLLVDSILSLLVVSQGLEESGSCSSEGSLSVLAVLLHLGLDLVEGTEELVLHVHHLLLGVSLVGSHESLELGILLEVLSIAVVPDLHHARELSIHLVVNLSLLELVRGDEGTELGLAMVELLGLLLALLGQSQDISVEAGLEALDTVVSLLLCLSDVSHGLGETLILQCSLRGECGVHAGGGVSELSVSVSAVVGHGLACCSELGGNLSSHCLDLVVSIGTELLVLSSSLCSELGAALLGLLLHVCHLVVESIHGVVEVLASLLCVLLDLSRILSNVLVGLLDLGVGLSSKGSEGALLSSGGSLQVASSLLLVPLHDLASPLEASVVLPPALVLEGSGISELLLGLTHSSSKIVLSNLRVDSHLGEQHGLHLLAGLDVELHVLSHACADSFDVLLAGLDLLGNVCLDLLEESEQALTTLGALLERVGGLGVQETCLHHIEGIDGIRIMDALPRADVLLGCENDLSTVGRDVHHAAAHSQTAEKRESDAGGAGGLRLFHHLYYGAGPH